MFSTPDEAIFAGRSNDTMELLKAWGGTTVAYAVFQTGAANLASSRFLLNLAIAAVVCGLGFVLHELAHRIVARRFGAQAHFVANVQMLAISIVVALLPLGLFFAAPGAVWHRGYLTPRQSGLIALAGPATNLALALLFLVIAPFVFLAGLRDQWIVGLFATGVALNAWLGLFNMIPAGPFDGAKVLAWSPVVFGVTVAIGILLAFVLPGAMLGIWLFVMRMLGG
ncbi:MAG: peptidase M50 [Chloroflexi bacterium]|nr:peptidase M50 [Chloroflexota bacterium]